MSSLCQCGYCRQSGAATMPVQSDSCSAVHMFPKSFFKHIVPALLAGLGLRLFFVWHFPFYSGDTAYYEELARNWLRSEERRVGKSVDLGGRRIIKKKKKKQ